MKNVSEKFQIPRYLNPNGSNFFVLPTIKLALPTIKSAFPTIKSPSKLNYQFSIFLEMVHFSRFQVFSTRGSKLRKRGDRERKQTIAISLSGSVSVI